MLKSAYVVCLILSVGFCRPRDNCIDRDTSLTSQVEPLDQVEQKDNPEPVITNRSFARVACAAAGPADAAVCTQHCTGRGYHRGVCVNYGCNCV